MARGIGPPGPDSAVAVEYRADPLGFITRCVADYGDFVALRFTGRPTYVLGHPELAEHVLVRRADNYFRDATTQRYRRLLGDALLADDQEESWQLQRHRLQPLFSAACTAGRSRVLTDCAGLYVSRWTDGSLQDMYRQALGLTLDIMLRVLFGNGAGRSLEDIRQHADAAMRCMRAGMERPLRSAGDVSSARDASAFVQEMTWLRGLVETHVGERAQARHEGGRQESDILGALLREPDPMPSARLRDELISLLVSSHETTALALAYTMYLLAAHPEEQQTLGRELRDVLAGRPPGLSDLRRLTYTGQIVRESLRLFPPVWILTRDAVGDDMIDGYRVAAGSRILIPRWVIQRDPRFFDAPAEFRPQRWAAGGQAARHRLAYFPFGAGPRRCIGSTFALAELVLLVATFAQRARFALPADHALDLLPTLHIRPRDGLWLRVNSSTT